MGLSRTYSGCRKCPYVDTCDHKCMEALGYLPEQNIAAPATSPLAADMVQPMAVKHDYRDIKIAEGITVTIDIEELKKKMVDDFYRSVGMLSQG